MNIDWLIHQDPAQITTYLRERTDEQLDVLAEMRRKCITSCAAQLRQSWTRPEFREELTIRTTASRRFLLLLRDEQLTRAQKRYLEMAREIDEAEDAAAA